MNHPGLRYLLKPSFPVQDPLASAFGYFAYRINYDWGYSYDECIALWENTLSSSDRDFWQRQRDFWAAQRQ